MTTPDITAKQRRLVKGIVEGKTKKQAAIDAGYSERSAGPNASEALRNPNVQGALVAAMERAGITDESIVKTLKDGMTAQKVVATVMRKGKPELIERPDHAVRHKFAETVIDVKGAKAPKTVQVSGLDDLLSALDDDTDRGTEEEAQED